MTKYMIITLIALFAFAMSFVGATDSALAALEVDSGYINGATIKGAVRYRSFNSSGAKEVYVDGQDLQFKSNGECCAAGESNDIPYGSPLQTWNITFEYDGTDLRSVAQKGTTTVTTTKFGVGDLGSLNYLAFEVNVGNASRRVELQNVQVFKGPIALDQVCGELSSSWPGCTSGMSAGIKQVYATGEDLTGGFKVTGQIVITGTPQPGGDTNYVQMRVGYVVPPDNEGPITSNVQLTPNPALINGFAEVSANVDDSQTGNHPIVSATYQLNEGDWTDMDADDGIFNGVAEDVSATIAPLTKIGVNTVCVKGTDSLGNEGGLDADGNNGINPCVDFVVTYAFEGFYSPVDNEATNDAKAGQAIPFKWRLTDANGEPISDPASFVGLYSYPISCDVLTGSSADAVEEYAAGDSGLQYNGDGYWQFNWKTPKTYASTCRAAYLAFNSTLTSPVVGIKFKK
jgi:hypothetical protein